MDFFEKTCMAIKKGYKYSFFIIFRCNIFDFHIWKGSNLILTFVNFYVRALYACKFKLTLGHFTLLEW